MTIAIGVQEVDVLFGGDPISPEAKRSGENNDCVFVVQHIGHISAPAHSREVQSFLTDIVPGLPLRGIEGWHWDFADAYLIVGITCCAGVDKHSPEVSVVLMHLVAIDDQTRQDNPSAGAPGLPGNLIEQHILYDSLVIGVVVVAACNVDAQAAGNEDIVGVVAEDVCGKPVLSAGGQGYLGDETGDLACVIAGRVCAHALVDEVVNLAHSADCPLVVQAGRGHLSLGDHHQELIIFSAFDKVALFFI